MTTYIVRRFFEAIPVLLGVSILVFLFIHIIPGDPAVALLGERATQENVERIREQLGLNKPLFLNFRGSTATLVGAESATLYDEPGSDVVTGEITSENVLTVLDRRGGWVRLSSVEREENQGWVLDPEATVDDLGAVTFSQERLRAFDEPVERGSRRLGSIEVAELTVIGTGEEPGWYQVTWIREISRQVGWLPEDEVDITVDILDSQYFIYMRGVLSGDFGHTIQGNIPIANELRRRLPATIELSIYALAIAVILGIPIGVLSAVHRNSMIDTASMTGALVGVSMPIFWLGLLFIYIFSIQLHVFPMMGRTELNTGMETITGIVTLDAVLQRNWTVLLDAFKHLIMPSIVLATVPVSMIARITRSSMLEVLGQDYVRTARAKGVIERIVINKHALRNALLPVVTVVGLQLGVLLSGAVLTESVFTWPGIGRWVFDAIMKREYPIIQSVTLIVAFIFVGINLLVDLSYGVLNPRVRLQ
jgi:ABC-type dipeptide/oligopeptide/nickel transport system permease component